MAITRRGLDWASWNRAGRIRSSRWVNVEGSASLRMNLDSLIIKRSRALELALVEHALSNVSRV